MKRHLAQQQTTQLLAIRIGVDKCGNDNSRSRRFCPQRGNGLRRIGSHLRHLQLSFELFLATFRAPEKVDGISDTMPSVALDTLQWPGAAKQVSMQSVVRVEAG